MPTIGIDGVKIAFKKQIGVAGKLFWTYSHVIKRYCRGNNVFEGFSCEFLFKRYFIKAGSVFVDL